MPVIELGLENRLVDLLEDLLRLLLRVVVGDQVQAGLTGSGNIHVQLELPGPVEQFRAGVDPHRAAVHHGHGPPAALAER